MPTQEAKRVSAAKYSHLGADFDQQQRRTDPVDAGQGL
jgi:hypothetical protein